jgi:hypothetical protein
MSSSPSGSLDEPETSTMPPVDRSQGRDIHIYDANDRNTVLGGLVLTDGITNKNFYSMVGIIFFFNGPYSLLDEGGTEIERNDDPLKPGNYYIDAKGRFPYTLL